MTPTAYATVNLYSHSFYIQCLPSFITHSLLSSTTHAHHIPFSDPTGPSPHLPLGPKHIGNHMMPFSLCMTVPLQPIICMPLHHLYHQHPQLLLNHLPYKKTIIFRILLSLLLLSLRLQGSWPLAMSRKATTPLVLLVESSIITPPVCLCKQQVL